MNLNLNQIFNRSEFIEWVNDFLPNFNLNIQKVDVPKGFKGATSIETLGESELGVRVFIIETDNDPSKRRIGWATDSFSVLKNSGSSNALMVYFSQETSQWRLSLLTSSPVWGDGKVILKLSNPKRQSYVLGPKAKVKTPQQFLINKGRITNLDDLKTRFSLEVVNKEFYKEISKLFTELVGGTVSVGKKKIVFEPLIKLPSTQDGSTISLEFAVRLIGRIIFCWFLREKRSSSGDSLMPKDLVSLESVDKNSDYYHKILEPIFFEVLNKPQKSRNEPFDTGLFSKIPYLNGGLFSPQKDSDFYEKSRNDLQSKFQNTLVVPNEWIKSLFEILETYNFTIDENTSFDEELSIDPEMLGRIFENLLAEINPETGESARKSTGSYYTPRIIVDYMVDESLCLYLKEKTGIEEKKLRSLISYDLGDDAPLTDEEKDKIIKYLGEVKILDPACGSGAFPIGALQKIVFILQQIDPKAEKMYELEIKQIPSELKRFIQREYEHGSFDYLRKLRIIRDCIYGVDIQPIATEISRLRCFLTLVVDQGIDDTQENRGIQPLPNLDFKFVTANSLIGLPKIDQPQQSMFDDHKQIDELKNIRNDYFNSTGIEREQLKTEFVMQQKKLVDQLIKEHGFMGISKAELTQKLTDWEPFTHKATPWFDPEWMFGLKDGFDIVIGNPPYVSAVTMARSVSQKREYKKLYPLATGSYDLYILFLFKALEILNNKGSYVWIIPNKFLIADYAKKCKELLIKTEGLITSIDVSDFNVFKETGVYPIIIVGKKGFDENYKELTIDSYEDLSQHMFKEVKKVKQHKTFKDFGIKLNAGTTGFQAQQIIPFLKSEKVNYSLPFIVSGSVDRYYWSNNNVRYMGKKYNQAFIIKSEYIANTKWNFWNSRKIIIAGMTKMIESVYSEDPIALGVGIYGIYDFAGFEPQCLTGLLNSKYMTYYFRQKFKDKHLAGGYLGINKSTIENLPLVDINKTDQLRISNIVNQILLLKKQDKNANTKKLETEIDMIVYSLFELTKEEIKIVENSVK